MTSLHEALDSLLAARLRHGSTIGEYLLPPVDRRTVETTLHPGELHASLFDLYAWRGGTDIDRLRVDDRWDTLIPEFDFVSPEKAREVVDRYEGFRADPLNPPEALNDIWRRDFCPVFVLDGGADLLPIDGDGRLWLMVPGAPPEMVFPSLEALVRVSVEVVEGRRDPLR